MNSHLKPNTNSKPLKRKRKTSDVKSRVSSTSSTGFLTKKKKKKCGYPMSPKLELLKKLIIDSSSSEDELIEMILTDAVAEEKKEKKRIWVKPTTSDWFETVFPTLAEEELKESLHVSRPTFQFLVEALAPHLRKSDTNYRRAIPVAKRVAVSLYHLTAPMSEYKLTAEKFGIGKSTTCIIVHDFANKVIDLLQEKFIKFPENSTQVDEIAKGFEEVHDIPLCAGALGACRFTIQTPRENPDAYCYESDHSIVVLGALDPYKKLMYMNIAEGQCSPDDFADMVQFLDDTLEKDSDGHDDLPINACTSDPQQLSIGDLESQKRLSNDVDAEQHTSNNNISDNVDTQQRTSVDQNAHQHTSGNLDTQQHTSVDQNAHQHTSGNVDTQHTSVDQNAHQHTSDNLDEQQYTTVPQPEHASETNAHQNPPNDLESIQHTLNSLLNNVASTASANSETISKEAGLFRPRLRQCFEVPDMNVMNLELYSEVYPLWSIIENTFKEIKARFRILSRKVDGDINFIHKLLRCCCILHNVCLTLEDQVDPEWLKDVLGH